MTPDQSWAPADEATTGPPVSGSESYYESPQAQAMDQTLAQAEGSVTPVVLGTLIAAYAAAEGTQSVFSGINKGISFGAELAGDTLEAFAKSVWFMFRRNKQARINMLKRELLPTAVRAVINLISYAPDEKKRNLFTNDIDPYAVAERAVDAAVNDVFGSLQTSAENTRDSVNRKDFRRDSTLFDTLSAVFKGDKPASSLRPHRKKVKRPDTGTDTANDTAQRQMNTAAIRFGRLLARNSAFSAQEAIAQALGFTHKRWITCQDDRVRLLHAARHGSVVRINERFQGPGNGIRWPGDPTAPLNDTANCRCSLEWVRR